ncbi:Cbb3-type cytochrome oxidase subunit 3 [Sphingobium chlorophenolicum L-1]|uniref:Cbb3-type cytochrome oxidase subunit 3 n=1 Tax=Sphingobium chlorophenolicum L-1 TaxID=690566 RepID=F6F3I6_SPHCR|nr:cbb3-type cytochrome c oxidase subunit 3 [Sphingobium chlorophenolicum]AEG50998.1 Cbb3-type cytochrome oxidase subunit 3 [Sphingobium chlorophenolicum L-1]
MSYDALRHFADSWGLVFMGVVYVTLIGWHFLPRGRERSAEATLAIFEQEEADHG